MDARQEHGDERLIAATLAGDDGAFAQLVGRHKRRIFGMAARFARDPDELEDICQEVFIKAFENLRSFRREAPFEHWLARIAVRVCHDALRSRQRSGSHQPLEEACQVRDHSAEARSETQQLREFLAWALERLTPDERLVITLLELEEKTVRETAALTGWSEANVKVRAHRARQALKRIVEEHDAQS